MTFSEVPTLAHGVPVWIPLPSVFRNLPGYTGIKKKWSFINSKLNDRYQNEQRLSYVNRIIRVANTVLSALAISLPKLIRGAILSTRIWRDTFLGIRELVLWMFWVFVHCGEDFLIERVKFLFKYMRFVGLEALENIPEPPHGMLGTRMITIGGQRRPLLLLLFLRGYCYELVPDFLRQYHPVSPGIYSIPFVNRSALVFSSGSRGLIPASLKQRKKAIREHLADMSRTDTHIPFTKIDKVDLLELGYNFASAFIKHMTDRRPLNINDIHVPISNSACLEYSTLHGGVRAGVSSIVPKETQERGVVALSSRPKTGASLFSLEEYLFFGGPRDSYEFFFPSWNEWSEADTITRAIPEAIIRDLRSGRVGSFVKARKKDDVFQWYTSKSGAVLQYVPQQDCWADIIAVEEQGFKARILSKLPFSVVYAGHVWRTFLKKIFRESKHISVFNKDSWKFIHRWASGSLGRYRALQEGKVLVYSADMKSATDLIPGKLLVGFISGFVSHIAEQYTELWDRSPLLSVSCQYLMPEIFLRYPGGVRVKQIQGTPMGHPMSWLPLNLYNYLLESLADFFARWVTIDPRLCMAEMVSQFMEQLHELLPEKLPLFYKELDQHDLVFMEKPFEVCGDDLATLMTIREIICYRAFHLLFGGRFSTSVDYLSKRYGVFTEHFFLLEGKGFEFHWLDYIPVRSFCKPVSRLPGEKDLPPWVSQGSALSSALRYQTGTQFYSDYVLWGSHVYRDTIKQLWGAGLEPYLPKALGGLGFPYWKTELFIRGPTKRAMRLLLAPDLKLSHLLCFNQLSQLTSQRNFFSKIGERVRKVLTLLISDLERRIAPVQSTLDKSVTGYFSLFDQICVSPYRMEKYKLFSQIPMEYGVKGPITHLDFASLKPLSDYLEEVGFVTFRNFVSELTHILNSRYFCEAGASPNLKPMTMLRVGYEFKSLIKKLNDNPHDPIHAPLTSTFLEGALKWKYDSVFINRKLVLSFMELMPDRIDLVLHEDENDRLSTESLFMHPTTELLGDRMVFEKEIESDLFSFGRQTVRDLQWSSRFFDL